MGLSDIPVEILTIILGFVIPYGWNVQCLCTCWDPPCPHYPKCLALRLTSRRFNSIISYHAIRTLDFESSHIMNRSTIHWLLATKLNSNHNKEMGLSAAIWNSVLSIGQWKKYNSEVFEEEEYLDAACGVAVLHKDLVWRWEEFESLFDDEDCELPSETDLSNRERGQLLSTEKQRAIDDMVCYQSLHVAAYYGDVSVVKTLLQNGYNPNLSNKYFGSALSAACCNGHLEIADLLIEYGSSRDEQGTRYQPLVVAADRGHLEVLQLLLDRYNVPTSIKENFLVPAITKNQRGVVEVFLSQPDIKVSLTDWCARVALCTACKIGSVDLVRLLLAHPSIDPNMPPRPVGVKTPLKEAITNGHMEVVQLLVKRDDLQPRFGSEDQCPMYEAANFGHVGIFRLILGRWESKLKHHAISQRVLNIAVASGHVEIVRLLLERREVIRCLVGRNGTMLLEHAVEDRRDRIVPLLLAHNEVDPNQPCLNWASSTPFLQAIIIGSVTMVQSFLERDDLDVNTLRWGEPALCIAARKRSPEILRLLLQRPGIDVNISGEEGKSALLCAVCAGRISNVKLMLEQPSIDPNGLSVTEWSPPWIEPKIDNDPPIQDKHGCTALLVAANYGFDIMVKNLLQHPDIQADLALPDGSTPLMLARQGGHDEVVRLLMEYHRRG